MMERGEVLATALSYITKDRAATHGDAENSFGVIASYWSTYLKSIGMDMGSLAPHDVAAMMILFKMARVGNNPSHSDNWIDTAGYSALGAEMS